jgi:DNA polymerase III epsilon subunit-like protein
MGYEDWRKKMPTPICDKPLTWIDTETTGLSADKNDIIEFYGVNEGTGAELHLYIHPERPENAHPKALEVNGYTEEAWKANGAIQMTEALPQISAFLVDVILAGQNVSFDERFIKATMGRHGDETRIGYHKLDTVSLSIATLRPLGIRSVSLHNVCKVLGVTNEGEHTAKADVRRTRAVYRALLSPSRRMLDYWQVRIAELNAEADAKKAAKADA